MAAPIGESRQKFLLHFAQEHIDFRLPELHALSEVFGFKAEVENHNPQSPYLLVGLPGESAARQLMSRSVLVRAVYEVWAHAQSHPALCRQLSALPARLQDQSVQSPESFMIDVDTFNNRISKAAKITKIETLLQPDVLAMKGPINLQSPCQRYMLFEYYGHVGTPPPDAPLESYFGRWIANGQRDVIHKFRLQKRKFIANTSMDACLSLLMSNLAKVRDADLVLDPFVGSGSLLVACAHHGAYVMGADIDYNIVHAQGKSSRVGEKYRAKDQSIRANLAQYNLDHRFVDVVVGDSSMHSLWRSDDFVDAIVTDPPYGIREATLKVGRRSENTISEEQRAAHIPCKVQYPIAQALLDMLQLAAHKLRMGGRLVYWLPVNPDSYSELNVPEHPCFRLVANCEQQIHSYFSRRLLLLTKTAEPQDTGQPAGVFRDAHYGRNRTFRQLYYRKERLAVMAEQQRCDVTTTSMEGRDVTETHTATAGDGQRAGATGDVTSSADGGDGVTSPLVQYVIVRGDLRKPPLRWPEGAVIAQACHATAAVTHLHHAHPDTQRYLADLDRMHKVVLKAADQAALEDVAATLTSAGVDHKLWVEQPENIPTCVVLRPYRKQEVHGHLKHLKLFR